MTTIILKLTSDGAGVEIASAPAGTAYVKYALCTAETGGGVIYGSKLLPYPLTSPIKGTESHPWVGVQAMSAQDRELGGWAPRLKTGTHVEEPHEEPRKEEAGHSTCLPAVHINWNPEAESTWREAAETGAKVGRASGKIKALATGALKAGMKVDWLLTGPPSSLASALAEYSVLTTEQKAAVAAIEWGNENWNDGAGTPLTGRIYGESFVKAANEARGASLPIPILCQVRLSPDLGEEWMASLVTTPGLKDALEGNGLASHPYNHNMLLAQREPTNLGSYTDTSGASWGSERWMKEQYYIFEKLGILVPLAITENGVAATPGVANSVGSGGWAAVAENAQQYLAFVKLVKEDKVPSASLPGPNYSPVLIFATWYDLHGNRQGAETFGLFFYEEGGKPKGHNEEANFFAKFKAAAALNSAA